MDAPAVTPTPETFPGLELSELELALGNVRQAIDARDTPEPAGTSLQADLEETPVVAADVGEPDADIAATDDLEAELERELQLSTAPEPAAEPDDEVPSAPEAVVSEEPTLPVTPELETVELELALQHEDLVRLTFEDSLKTALDKLGGKLLFDMRLDNVADCQRVAAVSLGDGEDKQFALVIMPKNGGSVRVESTGESENPLAAIAESYEGVMNALKMAA